MSVLSAVLSEETSLELSEDTSMLSVELSVLLSAEELAVSDEELAARKAKWQPREPKVTTGYLARYASMVTSGNRGAILQIPGTGEEK